MNLAHITTEPGLEVGTKTLAVCGRKHKVEVLWDDVPKDHAICRDCVDGLIDAVNEVNDQVSYLKRTGLRMLNTFESMIVELAQPNAMTHIIESADEYAEKRKEKKAKKNAKTCTCLWAEDGERILQLDCPVHDADGDGAQ
jgi:hypothetical protein